MNDLLRILLGGGLAGIPTNNIPKPLMMAGLGLGGPSYLDYLKKNPRELGVIPGMVSGKPPVGGK